MYFESQVYDGVAGLQRGEYENCTFTNCDLAESDFTGFKFIDSVFEGCNLSMIKLAATAFQDVSFKDCKMLGIRFDTASGFGLSFSFENCRLDHSSFFRLKLRKTRFTNCEMEGVDFGEADLTEAVFENVKLVKAIFDNTILEKADLRMASGFSIDPERNKLKKTKFAQSNIAGLLDKYGIQVDRSL
ncbi:MAG: pentapeptide repeat-containing protein [Leadbetterella sp.]|nr:pentapeptide repeat-containing protein [Leadbetterella sp.]